MAASNNGRQESNRVLVQLISEMVEKHPYLRFHQILHSLDVEVQAEAGSTTKDLFHEESTVTLERVSKAFTKMDSSQNANS